MKRFQLGNIIALGLFAALLSACAGDRPDNLGAKKGVLAPCPATPNCVSSQGAAERHRIAPLSFSSSPEAAMMRLKKILTDRKDTTIIEASSSYLRVEFRTTFFVDDGEFLLDPEQKLIHVRSASRIGYSDLGKNRCRLTEIRRDFAKRGE